jgi:hypothetical protein
MALIYGEAHFIQRTLAAKVFGQLFDFNDE